MPIVFFFFSSRRRHTRCSRDWSSDVCSSDLPRAVRRFVVIAGEPPDPDGPERTGAARTRFDPGLDTVDGLQTAPNRLTATGASEMMLAAAAAPDKLSGPGLAPPTRRWNGSKRAVSG